MVFLTNKNDNARLGFRSSIVHKKKGKKTFSILETNILRVTQRQTRKKPDLRDSVKQKISFDKEKNRGAKQRKRAESIDCIISEQNKKKKLQIPF